MSVLLPRGLIVSLTPSPQSPWQHTQDVVRLAAAAQAGGAVAVKVDGPDAVRAVKRSVPGLPVLAVSIDGSHGGAVRITPTVRHAAALAEAGADVVELEADSAARRHDGQDLAELIASFAALGRPVKAGVAGVEDARTAVAAGAAMVSSSTMGYPAAPTPAPCPTSPSSPPSSRTPASPSSPNAATPHRPTPAPPSQPAPTPSSSAPPSPTRSGSPPASPPWRDTP